MAGQTRTVWLPGALAAMVCAVLVVGVERSAAQVGRPPGFGDTVRLLEQSTFGPTLEQIATVRDRASMRFWPSSSRRHCRPTPTCRRCPPRDQPTAPASASGTTTRCIRCKCTSSRMPCRDADQLRQRVAWALSQILRHFRARRDPLELDAALPAAALPERVRQLPPVAVRRDAQRGDGSLPRRRQQSVPDAYAARRQRVPDRRRRQAQRKLRARAPPAVLDWRRAVASGRHADPGCPARLHPRIRPGDHRGVLARVHRLGVRGAVRRGHPELQRSAARHREPTRQGAENPLERGRAPRRADRGRGAAGRAGQHHGPPERRAVSLQAAHSAPGHQQPEPKICQGYRCSVCRHDRLADPAAGGGPRHSPASLGTRKMSSAAPGTAGSASRCSS